MGGGRRSRIEGVQERGSRSLYQYKSGRDGAVETDSDRLDT